MAYRTLSYTIDIICWAYAGATGPMRSRIASEEAFPLGASIRFYLGLVIIYIAVGSPLTRSLNFYSVPYGSTYAFDLHCSDFIDLRNARSLIDAFIQRTKLGPYFVLNQSCLWRPFIHLCFHPLAYPHTYGGLN